MVGTYCLFSAGSIAFLKILKKNKNYYYQTRHFTSISGMLYRMKQNAVGLANICILSTGVLLVISIRHVCGRELRRLPIRGFHIRFDRSKYWRERHYEDGETGQSEDDRGSENWD